MRSRSNNKKAVSGLPDLKKLVSSLSRHAGSPGFESRLLSALSAFGDAAIRLARIEAECLSQEYDLKLHRQRTLEVYPEDDATVDFYKIQKAIDHANPGDRILLKSGTFRSGGVVWVDKDLSIEGSAGTLIQGTVHHGGKVVADPQTNGGFILDKNPKVEIKGIDFRNLYFAAASHDSHELDTLVFADNICEDVYHSVYMSGKSRLFARDNRIGITSLNQSSSSCRFNFFDESHVFGFYCKGGSSILQGNSLEVSELGARNQFHSVGAYVSGGNACVCNNFLKGWHAPISVHESQFPLIYNNEVLGLSEDPLHSPCGIAVRRCVHPSVCSNSIRSRNLGQGGYGIAASVISDGAIMDNQVDVTDSEAGILLYRSNGMMVCRNRLTSPLSLFGDQSDYAKGNIVFSNSIDGKIGLKMNYASGNLLIGKSLAGMEEADNRMMGFGGSYEEQSPAGIAKEDSERGMRADEHLLRRVWPRKR